MAAYGVIFMTSAILLVKLNSLRYKAVINDYSVQ